MTETHAAPRTGAPEWVRDAVFYQIFPDRFARSPRVRKPSNLLPWDAPPTAQGYHGGDLLGIVEQLDYLTDLGITALYLTPVFQSACNHRYHTHDYYQVDPLLGGNQALRELVQQAHARNVRVVLDGVFNHASRGFFAFNDILENGPHSPWLDWFHIEGWPLAPYDGRRPANYEGWAGNRALPKFNTDNPQVREFLMEVGEFWIREYEIDGWRLDVPAEITTPGFWEEFRDRVRAVNPDAYLVGEIWREAPDWVRGDRFDATMNYVFAAAAIAFAAGPRVSRSLVADRSYDPFPGIDAPQFVQRVERLLAAYAWETTQVQLNLLGSHDAPRVLSIARGDKASLRLATLLQMTWPGAPCVYYGDEIALQGTRRYDRPHRDQDSRWPFPWHAPQRWDQQMRDFFRRLIAVRRTNPALRSGQVRMIHAENDVLVFSRESTEHSLLIAINAGDGPADAGFHAGGPFREGRALQPLLGGSGPIQVPSGRMTLNLPPRDGLILA